MTSCALRPDLGPGKVLDDVRSAGAGRHHAPHAVRRPEGTGLVQCKYYIIVGIFLSLRKSVLSQISFANKFKLGSRYDVRHGTADVVREVA